MINRAALQTSWTPLALLTVAYTTFAYVGLNWAQFEGAGSPIWPAAGLALAGLMIGGIHLWPSILVGRLVAAYLSGSEQPLPVELLIAGGNTLAALIPAYLLRRNRVTAALLSVEGTLRFMAYGAGLGAIIAAVIGTLAITVSAGLTSTRALTIFLLWVSGFFAGTIIVCPLVQLLWQHNWRHRLDWRKTGSAALPVILLAIGAWLIFQQPTETQLRAWHILPLLVWTAIAGRAQAIIGLAIVSVIIIVASTAGTFRFSASMAPLDHVILLQQYLAVIGATVLCLAAALDEQKRSSASSLRLALDGADQGTFAYDTTRDIANFDPRTCELFGVPAGANIYTLEGMIALVHPDDRPTVREAAARALAPAGDGIYQVEHRLPTDDDKPRWVAIRGQTVFSGEAGFKTPVRISGVVRDITPQKIAEQRLNILAREVAHRAKNQLAVIRSIASRTLTGSVSLDDGRKAFLGRLHAMAGAFDLLHNSSMQHAPLRAIVESGLNIAPGRADINGPDILVQSEAVQPFSMLVHELTTNALKHGALAQDGGTIAISWSINRDQAFTFQWLEHCPSPLPAQTEEASTGFGTTLISSVLPQQLWGEAVVSYTDNGLAYTLTCPFEALAGTTKHIDDRAA